jgi:CHAT domain-containing protein/tetratricopeptide (TPR) repeat protein
VPKHPLTLSAIIGSTLMALLLTGSPRIAATSANSALGIPKELTALKKEAMVSYLAGRYGDARTAFLRAAERAEQTGVPGEAARDWNSAGACSIITSQFRTAFDEFARAQKLAESVHDEKALAATLNNVASLYLQIGQYEQAMRVAKEGLARNAVDFQPEARSKLRFQLAVSLSRLGRMDEAEPYFRMALAELISAKNYTETAMAYGLLGSAYLKAGRLPRAEQALNEGLRLVRAHKLNTSASIFSGLARLKARQNHPVAAAEFFDAALLVPQSPTPRWMILADRGQFRLDCGDLTGALDDFRDSRRIASQMRVDMVPADRDRVAFESGLSMVFEGLVDAGNRLAQKTGDNSILQETFDAAEQDRLWSLRALLPGTHDWRSRLPTEYWERLARFQTLERSAVARGASEADAQTTALRVELARYEANAAGKATESKEPPLSHIRRVLPDDTALFSFHISAHSSWVWAVDRRHVVAFPLAPAKQIQTAVREFATAVRDGKPSSSIGAGLYRDLFGSIPAAFLDRKHWRLELDGPLYELPFAALTVGEDSHGPVYLIEKADLETIPGALLATRDAIPATGTFLGIGDPVYNAADSRYRGAKGAAGLSLARLPNTAAELETCSQAWNPSARRLLTGPEAQIDSVRTALQSNPAIIHFATHVVPAKDEFQSGLIALSLDSGGAVGLLGPKEIVARAVNCKLVVMNGCHSAQGEALPSVGLMGLTRAWIGAGAMSVMATHWDIPDDSAQSLLTDFYRSLKTSPIGGTAAALRHAQLAALNMPGARQRPQQWAGYFLLSRML